MDQKVTLMVDGRTYRGTYNHQPGGLPVLIIAGTIFRGSSLGPANYMCDPSKADREYWRTLVRDYKQSKI